MSNRARLLVTLALDSPSGTVGSHQVSRVNNLTNTFYDASTSQKTDRTDPEPVEDLLRSRELKDLVLTTLEVAQTQTEIKKTETPHSKTVIAEDIAEESYYLEQNSDSDNIPITIVHQEEELIEEENNNVYNATSENSDTETHSNEPDPFSDSGSEYSPTENETDSEQDVLGNQDHQVIPDGRAKKRRSRGQGDPSQWKRAKYSQARLKGHEYMGFQKNSEGKYQQTALKGQRKVKPSCGGHKNDSKGPQQKFECSQITNEMRNQIFQYFWEISSWEGKKVYVTSLILHSQPKHRRRNTVEEESRKKTGFKYYLMATDNQKSTKKYPVCKKLFLGTLGVGERCVREWVSKKKWLPNREQAIEPVLVEPPQDSECTKNVNKFLDSLPKVESHYCRASSRKFYLEPTWNSYRHLHREFISYCERQNIRSCSWRLFFKTFKAKNLEIYTPRKDQCNTCVKFKKGNLNKVDYDSHIANKEHARLEKEQDKQKAISSEAENLTCVYTMDLQAVLLCPYTQASAMYYKQKLKVHNQTFFNLSDRDVSCYLWHEGNGGLDSDVFVSILLKFLNGEIETHNPKAIILWSDGCAYQNRNVNMSNGLLELAMEKNIIIEQKYLEVGHTQMEVDSVHSVIERRLGRKKDIAVPADYIKVIRAARQNPSPYKVVTLQFSDFLKYNKGMYTQIRPGNKKGDPCVTDICALQYLPQGVIKYKINFSNEWLELPRRPSTRTSFSHEPLYLSPRRIDDTKFVHLQELKAVIEPDYHGFYDNLMHSCQSSQVCSHMKN